MIVEYKSAESTIEKMNQETNDHYYWDGWTLCKFSPNPTAIYDKSGAYKDAIGWGFITKYEINKDGSWTVDY